MPGRLTTHVLDTARGRPASGLKIELFRIEGGDRLPLGSFVTNSDGRVDGPVLAPPEFRQGEYELVFHAGEYQAAAAAPDGVPRFLDTVPVRFGLSADEHYHVPLLLSPFGYSTYRGS